MQRGKSEDWRLGRVHFFADDAIKSAMRWKPGNQSPINRNRNPKWTASCTWFPGAMLVVLWRFDLVVLGFTESNWILPSIWPGSKLFLLLNRVLDPSRVTDEADTQLSPVLRGGNPTRRVPLRETPARQNWVEKLGNEVAVEKKNKQTEEIKTKKSSSPVICREPSRLNGESNERQRATDRQKKPKRAKNFAAHERQNQYGETARDVDWKGNTTGRVF